MTHLLSVCTTGVAHVQWVVGRLDGYGAADGCRQLGHPQKLKRVFNLF